ncbi:MAG: hypothetical protein AVDCRST_MAG50-1676 [uncultured Acidimicrobiales bacterium]|uniref:Ferritin-like domain-containing protein n=1 Tax=uncultured Acidimicrobiales bacterium TaxID=310071 RepID=A0A6J4HN84_9ACTN|nr:MAG: hypothetical protein AVDCRST_MAG50-1676 [uncultured Acidimicrobiales bacterium]
MEISEASLRAMVRDVDDEHRSGLPTLQDDIRALHAETRAQRTSRRTVLKRVGQGGAVLAIGGALWPAAARPAGAQAATPEPDDAEIAAFAESVELAIVEAYRQAVAGGKIRVAAGNEALTTFAGHHQQHATALSTLAAAKATRRPNQSILTKVTDQLRAASTERDVLKLAYELENAAASTYLQSLGSLDSTAALQLAASILPIESQHAVVLGQAAGVTLAGESGYVPTFQRSDQGVSPDDHPLSQ